MKALNKTGVIYIIINKRKFSFFWALARFREEVYDGVLREGRLAFQKAFMKELEDRIRKEGFAVGEDIVKVDSFINHQIDIALLNDISAFLTKDFKNIDKILTIETSGIAFAVGAAQHLGNIPVVFAKKSKSRIVDTTNVYSTKIKSFTRGKISTATIDKRFLRKDERILIVDDFLANGSAALGLIDICQQAGAKVEGIAIVIEKSFQKGRQKLDALGYKVISAANIESIQNGQIIFSR